MSDRLRLTFVDVSDIDGGLEAAFIRLRERSGKGSVLVSYGFGRQVNQWLATVWPRCLKRLAEEGQTRWYGDDGKNYYIRYIPNRCFDMGVLGGGARVRVYDLKPWFGNLSKEQALEATGTKDLSELGEWLLDYLEEIDARPAHGWYGPGSSAATLMRRHGVQSHGSEHRRLYDFAYYGGRIQALQVGDIGPATRYDIRSAYASSLVRLPSLVGEWRLLDRRSPISDLEVTPELCLVRVSWSTPADYPLTPFPWRGWDGNISYPREGRGWYWGSLVWAAMGGPWEITVEEGWRFVPDNRDIRPFAYIQNLHDARMAQTHPVKSAILKALMVSTYGKLMQWSECRNKGLRSMAWSGMVTADIQARLLEVAVQTPDRVASSLTDGLFLSGHEPIGSLRIGRELGCWSREPYDGLWVFQPAFYVTGRKNGDGMHYDLHAAGMTDDQLIARRAVGSWLANGLDGKVNFSNRAYCGIAMARQRGWSDWNSWVDLPGTMRLHPTQGFPGDAVSEDYRAWRWQCYNPAEDHSALSSAYVTKGGGLTEWRYADVEEIRAREECLG